MAPGSEGGGKVDQRHTNRVRRCISQIWALPPFKILNITQVANKAVTQVRSPPSLGTRPVPHRPLKRGGTSQSPPFLPQVATKAVTQVRSPPSPPLKRGGTSQSPLFPLVYPRSQALPYPRFQAEPGNAALPSFPGRAWKRRFGGSASKSCNLS